MTKLKTLVNCGKHNYLYDNDISGVKCPDCQDIAQVDNEYEAEEAGRQSEYEAEYQEEQDRAEYESQGYEGE